MQRSFAAFSKPHLLSSTDFAWADVVQDKKKGPALKAGPHFADWLNPVMHLQLIQGRTTMSLRTARTFFVSRARVSACAFSAADLAKPES